MNDYTSSITIDIKPKGFKKEYRLISFIGSLDKAGLTEIRDQVEEVTESVQEEQYLVFNFQNLEFINSESIGFLLMIHTRLVKKDKKLVIVDAVDHVKDVLEVIGMLKIVEYHPTMEDFERNI
ncbi:MAG TPA: STAS domain-containing protein [Candidatus Gracilibacteria bacterium]|nr:STAS domain-containing protein [Candidatus Gracilibacteria bacterium]